MTETSMFRKLNVLMVSDDFYPQVGGIAAHVLEISKAISKLGHNVVLLTKVYDPSGELPEEEMVDRIRVIRVRVSETRKIRALQFVYRGRKKIKELLAEDDYQVIHWHKLIADSMITKIPFDGVKIFTNHSSTFLHWYEEQRFARFRFLLGHMDGVIAPSTELTTKIATVFPMKQALTISNGVDTTKFYPDQDKRETMRARLGYKNENKVVMIARRLEEKNGVLYFVKAISMMLTQNEDIRILMVGSGSQEQIIRDFVKENGWDDKVSLVTGVANPEMPYYFNAADLVVLPSLMEATSIAGLEAMACGKALVGTEVGGIPEIIKQNETGVLIPAKSETAIATGVLSILEDDTIRLGMGRAALHSVQQNFSWQEIAHKTTDFYEEQLRRLL